MGCRLGVIVPSLAVAVYALFLPFYGPALDHHIAEREASHQHIYVEHASPTHAHPYEVPHTHGTTQASADSRVPGASSAHLRSGGMVCLPSHDAMGQVVAQLKVSAVHVSLGIPDLGDRHSTFATPGDGGFCQDVFIAPPRKPPRV